MKQTTITPDPRGDNTLEALRATLRSLRLTSMAEDVPELLELSQKDGWGQLELLFELFQREEVRKHQRRYRGQSQKSVICMVPKHERHSLGFSPHFLTHSFPCSADTSNPPQTFQDWWLLWKMAILSLRRPQTK